MKPVQRLAAATLLLLALALPLRGQAAPNSLSLPFDATGQQPAYLRPPAAWTDNLHLSSNTNKTYTIPAGARYLIFGGGCSVFYVKRNGAASIPSGDVTDGTASTGNPPGYYVQGVTTLGVISAANCDLSVDVYN
ncbi:MAG TPA: hypothetical protein VN667_02935 [Burkholderiales bacterium]|nr:hypothetical protein [Burkholderiales bacterium]